jgi:hypothetical protein
MHPESQCEIRTHCAKRATRKFKMDQEMEKDKAAEYRKMAADCLEVAQRMSFSTDRARMTQMARRWLDLAQQAEGEPPQSN